MIDLYTAATPNGRKASIMLEECELPYEATWFDLGELTQKESWFLKINPNGRIPAIVDRDEQDFAVFESGAILIYLAEKTGMLMPAENRWEILQWLMWQMGGFGPMLGQAHHFIHFNPDASDYARRRYTEEADRLYSVLDDQLEKNEYVAGEYSIADVSIWPWAAKSRPLPRPVATPAPPIPVNPPFRPLAPLWRAVRLPIFQPVARLISF